MENARVSFRFRAGFLVSIFLSLVSLLPVPAAAGTGWDAGVPIGTEALRKDLASPPHPGVDVTLFSPDDHLGDVFLPLYREKKIRSLTVVVPAGNPLEEGNLSSWKRYVGGLYAGADDLFVLREGALEGKVDGLAVRVLSVGNWKGAEENGVVILDLAFLTAMYQDEVRTPFVDLPRKFAATLEDRGIAFSGVRVWVADRSRIPLARGYLPKLVSEIRRDPAAFRGEVPRKWAELRQGEYLAFFSAYEDAGLHLEGYLKEEPEEPSVLFTIASTHFVDREIERGLRFLQRAWKVDPYYIRGYAEAALQFFRADKLEASERVLRAGLLHDPSAPELKEGLAHVLLEQAVKMLPRDPTGAEARFAEIDGIVGLGEDSLRPIRIRWEKEKEKASSGESIRVPATGTPRGHGHPAGGFE